MWRRKGRRQAQAHGLTSVYRQRLLDGAGDRLIDARNRALVAVAYDALLRRSELVALNVSDIVEESDGTATLLVRSSRTDPEGRGAQLYVAPDSVRLLREWLKRSDVVEGMVFRSLCRGVLGEGLEAGQIPRIFKLMARAANLPASVTAHISGHSSRVGAAQDMVGSGNRHSVRMAPTRPRGLLHSVARHLLHCDWHPPIERWQARPELLQSCYCN